MLTAKHTCEDADCHCLGLSMSQMVAEARNKDGHIDVALRKMAANIISQRVNVFLKLYYGKNEEDFVRGVAKELGLTEKISAERCWVIAATAGTELYHLLMSNKNFFSEESENETFWKDLEEKIIRKLCRLKIVKEDGMVHTTTHARNISLDETELALAKQCFQRLVKFTVLICGNTMNNMMVSFSNLIQLSKEIIVVGIDDALANCRLE